VVESFTGAYLKIEHVGTFTVMLLGLPRRAQQIQWRDLKGNILQPVPIPYKESGIESRESLDG